MKDYYYILGISRSATADQIKSAYRKLSIKFHPDKNEGDVFFEERFKEIQEAYEVLSNPNKRNLYDSSMYNFDHEKLKSDYEQKLKSVKKEYEEQLKRKEQEYGSRKEQEQQNKQNTQFGFKQNDFNIEMVFVQGGTFIMGNHDSKSREHKVTVDNFSIGKYPITQGQWKLIMGEEKKGLLTIFNDSFNEPIRFKGCTNCPVENVSWKDAQKFIKKLNSLTGKNYRLPTEAEWEYAAKGGNKSQGYKYSGSNEVNDVAWYGANSIDKTHPVGLKKPNELGIYDMSGNVSEYCEDWYSVNYYSESPLNNPTGPSRGNHKVVRGGNWLIPAKFLCENSHRSNYYDNERSSCNGFRIAYH